MKKNFKFMLVALVALFGFNSAMAAELVGSTQYTNDGYQYKILSLNTATQKGTVSVSQSNWNEKSAGDHSAIVINPTITINVKGEVSGDPIDATVVFDIVEIEADAFKGLDKIKTITFADGCKINSIGAGAFAGTKIKILDLTNTKITVLNKLFEYNNVELNQVIMPASIVSLADMALADCIQLSEVKFDGCTNLTTLGDGSLSNTIVPSYDFKDCINATAGTVLNFTATANPFVNAITKTNKNLTTVTLPVSTTTLGVTEIGKVFANCERLTTINNLDKTMITNVGAGAFVNDISLTSLSFPKTLATVGTDGAPFDGCKSLATLTFDGSALTTIGDGANDLFGTYKYDGAAFDPVLKNLIITVPVNTPKTSTSVEIKAKAFQGNGTTSVLEKVEIAKAGVFAGTINAGAIVLATANDATVEFGNVSGATFYTITGPKGTNKTALTIGEWNNAATAAIIDGVLSNVKVGEVKDGSIVIAAGKAEVLEFTGKISDALDPAAANDALTTIKFGGTTDGSGIEIAAGLIAATVFDETKAPNLKDVYWYPADDKAVAAFDKKAFGTDTKGSDAKVSLHTTTKVGVTIYAEDEVNKLHNVIFLCAPAIPEATAIPVYNNATTGYFYGKFKAVGGNFAIAKETVDNPATEDVDESGAQVVVYSAFVDESDNKLYMDPLAIKNGQYIVKANEVVIVRVKDPKGVKASETNTGAQEACVNAYATTDQYTMRITPYGGYAVVNDLKMNPILFSSDYIGTNFVGKTLYAMVNPGKVGKLDFKPVSLTQYLPANSVYVEKNETSAAGLTVVWLDGDEATGIINKMVEKTQDGAIYNLQGIRVNGAQKGVYIQNGKKFIVK